MSFVPHIIHFLLKNWAIPGLLYFIFVFSIQFIVDKNLPMTGFELAISNVEGDTEPQPLPYRVDFFASAEPKEDRGGVHRRRSHDGFPRDVAFPLALLKAVHVLRRRNAPRSVSCCQRLSTLATL